MVQSCLLLRGDQENQSEGTSLPSGGGGFINPVLALFAVHGRHGTVENSLRILEF